MSAEELTPEKFIGKVYPDPDYLLDKDVAYSILLTLMENNRYETNIHLLR